MHVEVLVLLVHSSGVGNLVLALWRLWFCTWRRNFQSPSWSPFSALPTCSIFVLCIPSPDLIVSVTRQFRIDFVSVLFDSGGMLRG